MTYRKFSSFTEGLDTQKLKEKKGGGGVEDHDRSFLSFFGEAHREDVLVGGMPLRNITGSTYRLNFRSGGKYGA